MHPALSFVTLGVVVVGWFNAGQPAGPQGSALPPGQLSSPGSALQPASIVCATSIRDQANPGSCLQASSVPTPGLLFPPPHDGGQNNATGGTNSFIGGGQSNTTTGGHATIGGGLLNEADGYSTVGGGTSNQASGNGSIGGGQGNLASNTGAIGGGVFNRATGARSAIAGGYFNSASGYFSFVGGGYYNVASGYMSSVAGGQYNSAGSRAFVGGGFINSAFGYLSVISGGAANSASGEHSAIPGGGNNVAAGGYSFAAGRRAQANHAGSFVWGDSQSAVKASSAANEFNVFASGGARVFSDAAGTTGVLLAPGGGSWSSVSDRAAKENVAAVDALDVLERLRALPVSSWNYKTQADSVRHMGPVAQDFYALFGLGPSDTTIDTIDADGVALAAIQGLSALVSEQATQIAALEARLAALEGERRTSAALTR